MNKILNKNVLKILNTRHKYSLIYSNNNEWICGQNMWQRIGLIGSIDKRFAGHSKWQNIKHTKLTKDAQKSQIINRLLNKVKISLRNTGGTDPKINKEFGDVMEMCRRANISNTTIDKAINRAMNKRSIPMKLEIMGPNGCLIVLDAEADNKSQLKFVVKSVLKKYKEFAFVDEGRAMYAFHEKGIVRVRDVDKKGLKIDLEKAEEIGIESDAEEVNPDPEDDSVLVFVTEIQNTHKTRKYIEENTELEVIESGIQLLPYSRVDLPEETLQVVVNAIDELESLEEINRVYNNIN